MIWEYEKRKVTVWDLNPSFYFESCLFKREKSNTPHSHANSLVSTNWYSPSPIHISIKRGAWICIFHRLQKTTRFQNFQNATTRGGFVHAKCQSTVNAIIICLLHPECNFHFILITSDPLFQMSLNKCPPLLPIASAEAILNILQAKIAEVLKFMPFLSRVDDWWNAHFQACENMSQK